MSINNGRVRMSEQTTNKELGRLRHALAPAIDSHLQFYQFEGLVDGTLAATQRNAAEAHVAYCAECREELKSMRAFAADGGNGITPTAWRESMFGVAWLPVAVMAVMILVIIGGIFWYTMRSRGAQEQLASETRPVFRTPVEMSPQIDTAPDNAAPDADGPAGVRQLASKLKDGTQTVGLDETGSLVGYQNLRASERKMVESALRSGTVMVAPVLSDLQTPNSARMGASGEEQNGRFDLIGPVGKVILAARPQLRWQPLSGSIGYRVDVFDTNYNKVVSSDMIAFTSFSPSLRSGKTYIWQVTAFRDGEEVRSPVRPAPEARFHIIDERQHAEIDQLRSRGSRLPLALAFAKAGLIEEARRELQILTKENPGAEILRKLLSQLQKQK